jgi:hypothetical protein
MKDLKEENARLKRIIANQTMEITLLQQYWKKVRSPDYKREVPEC